MSMLWYKMVNVAVRKFRCGVRPIYREAEALSSLASVHLGRQKVGDWVRGRGVPVGVLEWGRLIFCPLPLYPACAGRESAEVAQLFGVTQSERGRCGVCKHFLSKILRVDILHQQVGKIRHAQNDGAEETAKSLVGLAIKSLQVGQCGLARSYR